MGSESGERGFSNFLDVFWSTVHADGPTALRIEFESKLCGDYYLFAVHKKRFTHELLVRERAINFSGVEECHPTLYCLANQQNHLLFIFRGSVPKAHPHAAESNCRNFQPALSKLPFFHSVT